MKSGFRLGFAILLACAALVRAAPFQDGETVCFLGDSITHGGTYHSFIYDYYLTRFPDRTIRFVNAGISGDQAGGALERLDEDVLAYHPTTVIIMLGMNDVGRGNYVEPPDPAKQKAAADAIDRYRTRMDKILETLRAAAPMNIVLLTPSPYDQTAVNDRNNNQPGCNDGLGRCADIVRDLAKKYSAEAVDFNGPMTAFNIARQAKDPAFTLIGPDRVHPGAPGHLMMAWLFLKAQEAPAWVSRIEVDAARGVWGEVFNAQVGDLKRTGDALTFTVQEKALPFPVNASAAAVLPMDDVARDLDREQLTVKGLPPGDYVLSMDGVDVGHYSAAEWAAGINTAFLAASPSVRQAKAVAQINEARRNAEVTLRHFAMVRQFLRRRQVDPDDLNAVAVFAETRMENKTGYIEKQVDPYIKNWNSRQITKDKVAELDHSARLAAQPKAHVYAIRPMTPATPETP